MFGKSKKGSVSAEQLMAEFLAKKELKAEDKSKNESSELEMKFTALWQLVKEKLNLTNDDLEAKIASIKEAQEKEKKVETKEEKAQTKERENCSKCGKPVSVKTGNCIYCGKDSL